MLNKKEIRERELVLSLVHKYRTSEKHAKFVEKAALKIFDSLKKIHGLGHEERVLLMHASLLHDIGSNINDKGHNKHSKYLIDNDEVLDHYPKNLKILLSYIVFNHRKKIHKGTFLLKKKTQKTVLILSSILRIADSLYYDKEEVLIKSITVDNLDVLITIENVLMERLQHRFNEKKKLFHDLFKLNVILKN